jgi:hypothetical protein
MTININDIIDFFKINPDETYTTPEIVSLIETKDYIRIIKLIKEVNAHGLTCCYRITPIPDRGLYLSVK